MSAPKALIAVAAPTIRDDVVRATQGRVELIATGTSFDFVSDRLDESINLIIVDVASLRAIARHMRNERPPEAAPFPAIILVLMNGELQDALGFLHLCHGILFWSHDLDRLSGLIVITLEGYSGVPPRMLPDLITDRVRVGLIDKLAPIEQRTLHLLAAALSNRAIAHELGVADPVAKSLVRSVLTKLRLKNRTEAAVLAARWFSMQEAKPAQKPAPTAEPIAS